MNVYSATTKVDYESFVKEYTCKTYLWRIMEDCSIYERKYACSNKRIFITCGRKEFSIVEQAAEF